MSSTLLSYQKLLTLSEELSTTEDTRKRARLIAQLIFTIEQGTSHPNSMDRLFFEKLKTQELAMTILEQNAAYIPIDEIIRMNFLGDPETSRAIQKIITIRRAEIPVTPFLDELLYDKYPRRHEAIQGLKALREYAPAEILLATIHDTDHVIAARAAEAIVLREEPLLLTTLLENFLNFHWYIQRAILDATNQLNIPVPLEFLIYALHRPELPMRTAVVQGLGKHGKDAPIDIIENALQDGYTSHEALQALGAITEYKNYSLFTEIVHDPQKLPELRIEAAQILARRGQYVPVQPLLTLLYDSNMMTNLRQLIQDILKEIGAAIVEDVLSYASISATITTQIAALQILSILDESSFNGKLNEITSNRQLDERLRRAAMKIIGEHKLLPSSDALRSILQTDTDEKIKEQAHNTLIKLGQIPEYEFYAPFGLRYPNRFNSPQQRYEQQHTILASLVQLVTSMQNDQAEPREIARAVADKIFEDYPVEQLAAFLPEHKREEATKKLSMSLALSALSHWPDESNELAMTVLQTLLYHEDHDIRTQCLLTLLPDHPELMLTHLDIAEKNDGFTSNTELEDIFGLEDHAHMFMGFQQEEQEQRTNTEGTVANILAQIEGNSFPATTFNESDVTVRRTVMYSLKGIGGDAPLDAILMALHDKDIYVRMNALTSAAELGTHVPLEPIIAALDDQDYGVRATAMQTLSYQKMRVPRAVFLKGLFIECDGGLPDMGQRDFEQPVPVIAAQVLGELHEMRAIEPLLILLHHREDEIRAAVLDALSQFGEHVPPAPFLDALSDSSSIVRISACRALEMQARAGIMFPIEPLLAALGDSDSDSMYNNSAFDRNYDDGGVRQAAARALLIAQPQALLALAPELNDTLDGRALSPLFDALMAAQSADTLQDIGYASPIFIEMLTQFLAHPYWEVRMKARKALDTLRATS